jgi:hypothetical protein
MNNKLKIGTFLVLTITIGFIIYNHAVLSDYFKFYNGRWAIISNQSKPEKKIFDSMNGKNETQNKESESDLNALNSKIEEIKRKNAVNFTPKIVLNGNVINGYGNRLYAFLSSLLMAILLDAHLFSDWPEIDTFVQDPLHQVFNKSLYMDFSNIHSSILVFKAASLNPWSVIKDLERLSKKELPEDKMIYHFDGFDAYFMELCCVPAYQDKLVEYGLVSIDVVKRAQEALEDKTMSLALKQDPIFQVGFDVGHNLLKHFWKIDPKFQLYIDKFYNEHFRGHTVIAMQLRYEYVSWDDTKLFIDCALAIQAQINKKNVKWFLTTDYFEYLKLIEDEYSNKLIHTVNFAKENQIDSKYGVTILDNELMSMSDYLIISGGSTYGFVAAMRQNELPFYVNGRRNTEKCLKMKFSQPSITNLGFSVF